MIHIVKALYESWIQAQCLADVIIYQTSTVFIFYHTQSESSVFILDAVYPFILNMAFGNSWSTKINVLLLYH